MHKKEPDQNLWWIFVNQYEEATDTEDESTDYDFTSDSDIDWDIEVPSEHFYIEVSDNNDSEDEIPPS